MAATDGVDDLGRPWCAACGAFMPVDAGGRCVDAAAHRRLRDRDRVADAQRAGVRSLEELKLAGDLAEKPSAFDEPARLGISVRAAAALLKVSPSTAAVGLRRSRRRQGLPDPSRDPSRRSARRR